MDTLPRLSLPGCGEQIHPVVDRCSFKLNHDITGAKTRGGARALRHHSLHDGTLVACRTRLALTWTASGDADPCPLHPRPLAQLWQDGLDRLQRYRQATARARPVKRGCHDHTDHLRLAVQQRGTRLARLNPRTDAHEVTAGHARETDPRREHFTCRHRAGLASRGTDHSHGVPNARTVACQLQGRQGRWGIDAQDGQIARHVVSDKGCVQRSHTREFHLQLLGAAGHVRSGQQPSLRINDKRGPRNRPRPDRTTHQSHGRRGLAEDGLGIKRRGGGGPGGEHRPAHGEQEHQWESEHTRPPAHQHLSLANHIIHGHLLLTPK